MITGHGGNIYEAARQLKCRPSEIVDMSSNINPLGPPNGLRSHLRENLDQILRLPDVAAETIARRFARHHGIDPNRVLAGNGTTQFIYTSPVALQIEKALIIGPTYADYADACRMHRVEFQHYLLEERHGFTGDIGEIEACLPGCDTVFICNPNNPTGGLLPSDQLEQLCAAHPNTRFVIDESYLPFVQHGQSVSMVRTKAPNIINLQSLSKIFRIPGLRIGFLVASPDNIAKFRRYLQPWSVNSLAQTACDYLLRPASKINAFIGQTQRYLDNERRCFNELNASSHFHVFPSTTTFLLIKLSSVLPAEELCSWILNEKILLRNCANFHGLSDRFVRISLRTRDMNQKVIHAMLRLSNQMSASISNLKLMSSVSHR